VAPGKSKRFIGMARKALYESLVAQKVDIRAHAINWNDEVAVSFADKINATATPTASVLQAGYTKWSSIEFEEVIGFFDDKKQDIPVSNKASGPDAMLSKKEIDSIGNFKTIREYREMKERLTAVNDVVTRLSGVDDLEFISARKRFRSVIAAHKKFERTYLADGKSIDDIPSDDLAEFVKSNPENSYTVLTEPKLGEVHKKVTRLFYMAQQALKMMTQVSERFTKKAISKSSGISIVKSYRARRKEIEEMLYAYTGAIMTIDEDGTPNVIFISFDMSEFSKKFPQALVRAIGKILSEISGEDWMGRIDVFFRAAVVYHNTRGFIGAKTGIRGGFEGFLNFLWTLGMKVVMDIATQSTGVTGVLAVYSDDGLLRLYIDGTKEEIKAKVMTIRKVFKDYGLIFHLDKTVASTEIFEYLGIYAELGMIIPTWIKEAMSIGKRKQTKGLETVYDRVSLWDSQCNAVVKANGPSYPSFLIKTILTMDTLRRLNTKAPSSSLAALTIIPYSAGGFRVSSVSEISILSSIEGLSEFSADIELLFDTYPSFAPAIAIRIFNNLKSEAEAEKSLITGSLLQTTLPDTSGLGIARELIEKSSIEDGGIIDPMRPAVVKKILSELKRCSNIRPRLVRNLIMEVPDVIEYNKSVAIIKSSAALKFVSQSEIKKSQSSDTYRCSNSIRGWVDYLRLNKDEERRIKSSDFLSACLAKLYPSYSIARMIDSPRTSLIPVKENADILTSMEFTVSDKPLYQEYVEPSAKFLGAQLSPESSAEASYSTTQRRNERFVATAARLVASNTSLIGVYYLVANAFDLPCPSLPSVTVTTGHRSSRNFGLNAVVVTLPVPYHAIISSRMSNTMWATLRNSTSRDRTTFVESAKLGNYLNNISYIKAGSRQSTTPKPVLFNLRDLTDNTANPIFITMASPNFDNVDTKTTKAFTTVIVEENAQANMSESTTMTAGILETLVDSPTTKAILLTRLEKWLMSSINGSLTKRGAPANIPDVWKREMFLESAVSVGFNLSSPDVRRATQLGFARFLELTDGRGARDSMEILDAVSHLNSGLNKYSTAFTHLEENIRKVSRALQFLDIDARTSEELGNMSFRYKPCTIAFVKFLKRKGVTGGTTCPTVVINTATFADSKISREVKNKFKSTIDSLLSQYLTKATSDESIMVNAKSDATINTLFLFKNMLRPSGHRGTPFNKHMVAIQLLKLEMFMTRKVDRGDSDTSIAELREYRIERRVSRRIMRNNAVIGGRTSLTSGRDMREALCDEGIPSWMFPRISYLLRKVRSDYVGCNVSEEGLMSNDTYFDTVLTYVLEVYNSIVGSVVSNIEIRHLRESEKVGSIELMTPVEDASFIAATISEGPMIAYEVDIVQRLESPTYRDMIANLLLAHYGRWGTNGYTSTVKVNDILRQFGIFGGSRLDVRSINESAFNSIEHDGEYTISISEYQSRESASHNYLYVNRLPGGMAVVCNDGETNILMSILPMGTQTINTYCTSVPVYFDPDSSEVPVYSIEKLQASMRQLSSVLNVRPRTVMDSGELGSIVLQQAYQRIVGARTTIEDSDHFLVAIAEIARGAWSMEAGMRILGMFAAWFTDVGATNRADYISSMRVIRGRASHPDSTVRLNILSSVSAVWEWVRMTNISAGPSINTDMVLTIVNSVSRDVAAGGGPATIYNMAPISHGGIINNRGVFTLDEFLRDAAALLFSVPYQEEDNLMFEFDSESEGDEW